MNSWLRKRFDRWISTRHPQQTQAVRIERERLYILPSGYGCFFALTLFVLFLWSINYNNSMGFILTFLLAALALNAMWRSHENLRQLVVHPGEAEPVFAGQLARFMYRLANPSAQPRHGIALQHLPSEIGHTDIGAQASATLALSLQTAQRGWLHPGRLRVSTQFPLGLFRAWTWHEFASACLVYPKPAGSLPLPGAADASLTGHALASAAPGRDDYAGLRGYVAGDSPRHIAWKASARGSTLLVKHFAGQALPQIWLDWRQLSRLPMEARLSQLCQWVLRAETAGYEYGLRVPGAEFAPDRGAHHRARCLRALALFERDENRAAR